MKFKKGVLSATLVSVAIAPAILSVACGAEQTEVVLALDGHDHSENDKSFNEAAYKAIKSFLNVDPTVVKPASPSGKNEFLQMYSNIAKNKIFVAPGYVHIDALNSATTELNDKKVILLDGYVNKANIASVTFKVEQAAYIAGYSLGRYFDATNATETDGLVDTTDSGGKIRVSTFGGMEFTTVTGFMNGLKQGLKKYIADTPTTKMEWFEFATKDEHFSGSFAKGDGKKVAEKLIGQGVDVILPVAGPQTEDVLQILKEKNKKGIAIGVDSVQEDLYNSTYPKKVAFSILKGLELATTNLLKIIKNGETFVGFEGLGKQTIGTLDNKLVGVSESTNSALGKAFNDIYKEDVAKPELVNLAKAVADTFNLG